MQPRIFGQGLYTTKREVYLNAPFSYMNLHSYATKHEYLNKLIYWNTPDPSAHAKTDAYQPHLRLRHAAMPHSPKREG